MVHHFTLPMFVISAMLLHDQSVKGKFGETARNYPKTFAIFSSSILASIVNHLFERPKSLPPPRSRDDDY